MKVLGLPCSSSDLRAGETSRQCERKEREGSDIVLMSVPVQVPREVLRLDKHGLFARP